MSVLLANANDRSAGGPEDAGALASAPEGVIALDMARRAVPLVLVPAGLSALVWGWSGAASAGFAVGLVVVNFLVSAWLLATTARISYALLMVAALFGYVLRLAMVTAAVLAVEDTAWVEPVPLGLTLVLFHLGLLAWELRYVSASLAFPGLQPAPKKAKPVIKENAAR